MTTPSIERIRDRLLELAQDHRGHAEADVRELCELAIRLDQRLSEGGDLPEDWLDDDDDDVGDGTNDDSGELDDAEEDDESEGERELA